MVIDPSSCAVRDPAVDIGIAKDKPAAVSPPDIRVTEGNPVSSDVTILVDNDKMEPVGASDLLLRKPGDAGDREIDGGSVREISSSGEIEFDTVVTEGYLAETETSVLGEMVDHELRFGVSDRKFTEMSTSLKVLMVDAKLESGIFERNSDEAGESL